MRGKSYCNQAVDRWLVIIQESIHVISCQIALDIYVRGQNHFVPGSIGNQWYAGLSCQVHPSPQTKCNLSIAHPKCSTKTFSFQWGFRDWARWAPPSLWEDWRCPHGLLQGLPGLNSVTNFCEFSLVRKLSLKMYHVVMQRMPNEIYVLCRQWSTSLGRRTSTWWSATRAMRPPQSEMRLLAESKNYCTWYNLYNREITCRLSQITMTDWHFSGMCDVLATAY